MVIIYTLFQTKTVQEPDTSMSHVPAKLKYRSTPPLLNPGEEGGQMHHKCKSIEIKAGTELNWTSLKAVMDCKVAHVLLYLL